MLCGWGGNSRPGLKWWQPTAGWMTYGHLRADCLYTGISSEPNTRYRVWEAFTFTFTIWLSSPELLHAGPAPPQRIFSPGQINSCTYCYYSENAYYCIIREHILSIVTLKFLLFYCLVLWHWLRVDTNVGIPKENEWRLFLQVSWWMGKGWGWISILWLASERSHENFVPVMHWEQRSA